MEDTPSDYARGMGDSSIAAVGRFMHLYPRYTHYSIVILISNPSSSQE
jgi:hypothetical protein